VFPLFRMDRERFLAERIRIALTQLREFNFGQRSRFVDLADGYRNREDKEEQDG